MRRAFVLGGVQSADGLPQVHALQTGNVADAKTLKDMLETVVKRVAVKRVVVAANRGLLSLNDIAELTRIAD